MKAHICLFYRKVKLYPMENAKQTKAFKSEGYAWSYFTVGKPWRSSEVGTTVGRS